MSRRVAALVYGRLVGSMLRKTVLAYFAERASDDGSGIFASKRTIASEIECTKQSVINTVKAFIEEGILIERGHHETSSGYTVVYDIVLSAVSALPPAKAPRIFSSIETKGLTGLDFDPSTSLIGAVNSVDPHQSTPLTQIVHEPSGKPDAKASKRGRILAQKPDSISERIWGDWLTHRKTAFTATALEGFEREAALAGWTLEAAIKEAIERGWQGFKADWVKDKQYGQHGNPKDGMGRTERAAERLKQQISGSAGRTGQGTSGFGAMHSGQSNRAIDAKPSPVRAIGHVG